MPCEDIAHVKLHAMEDLVQAAAAPRRQSADAGEARKIGGTPRSAFPLQGAQRLKNKLNPQFLFFVSERFAVGSYLNLGFLPVCFDLGLIGHELFLLGEGLDLQNFSFSGFGLQSRFDLRRE